MARVVSDIAPSLKSSSFKKRRHSFNRTTDDGIVQVVSFQMGPRLPPGAEPVPPIRLDLYGKFTINLGVFIAALEPMLGRSAQHAWINDYNCHCRMRIGELLPDPRDIWWSLDEPDSASQVAALALDTCGLPWLDSLRTEQAIMDGYTQRGEDAIGLPPVAALWIALLHLNNGNRPLAEAMVAEHLRSDLHQNHRRWLAEFLPKHELGHLIAD
jgi:hypothetical protein